MAMPGENDFIARLGTPNQFRQLPLGLADRYSHDFGSSGPLNGPNSTKQIDQLLDQIKRPHPSSLQAKQSSVSPLERFWIASSLTLPRDDEPLASLRIPGVVASSDNAISETMQRSTFRHSQSFDAHLHIKFARFIRAPRNGRQPMMPIIEPVVRR
jgi:hypothetical protein